MSVPTPRSAPVIERAPLPIVEVQGDAHIVSYVNAAFCSLLGKTREELLGKLFAEIVHRGEECLPILDQIYHTGHAVTHTLEDNSQAERSYWLYAMWPALDADERPVGVIIQLAKAAELPPDITSVNEALLLSALRQHELTENAEKLNQQLQAEIAERKQVEVELRESEERYRNLFNSMDEGYCIVELLFDEKNKPVDYCYLELNPSFENLTGMQNALGKRIRELVPDLETSWFEILGKVALTGEPIRFVNEARPMNRWFDVFAFRIGGADSRKVAILFTNVTEQRANETALRVSREVISQHANELEKTVIERTTSLQSSVKSLEDLNYTMAHDLRAPIRAMRGLTEALLEDVPLNEDGKDYAEKINKAAAKMDQLVNDLLDYGELSHLEFPKHSVDLKIEIEKVLSFSAHEIQSAQAEIQIQEPLPKVLANETLLEQILTNLILNALKFVAPGVKPKIIFRAELRGSAARLWVEDNGIGIAPHHQQQIFGVFHRLHTAEAFPGTGVGLAIIKRAVERMGGDVGLESELGQGSRFWIELPRV